MILFKIYGKKLTENYEHPLHVSWKKKEILMNSFIDAQFNYCPLIWMLHGLQNNSKIKHLNKWCLRLIHNDKLSSYEKLLKKVYSNSVHYRGIQSLAIKIFQLKHGQSCETVTDTFTWNTAVQFQAKSRF